MCLDETFIRCLAFHGARKCIRIITQLATQMEQLKVRFPMRRIAVSYSYCSFQ
jgi:hypothetical protein